MTPTSDHGACPSAALLRSIAHGATTTPEVERHLTNCGPCAERLNEALDSDSLLAELASLTKGTPSSALPEVHGCVVIREIHRGAQGIVYEAYHEATHRPVAVKVLTRGALRSVRQRARFEREVELAGALRHPGVVTIHDSGITRDALPFVVMELVQGDTLDRYLRAASLPPRRIVELFVLIADAVDHAHQHGIIHRDLKPSNILVDAEGQPRIVDFGIARPEGAESIEVTRPGDFIGTLAYAAPEQVASDAGAVGVRTDVYALGGLLFEALTGRRVVEPRSIADAVRAITDSPPPPPSSVQPRIDADIDAIVLKALAKRSTERYATAGALRDDLRRALAGLPVEARRHIRGYVLLRTLRRHRVPIAAAILTLAVVGALTGSVIIQSLRKARIESAKAGIGNTLTAIVDATNPETSDLFVPDIPALVDQLAVIVKSQLDEFPSERAHFENTLGLAYWNLNEVGKSIEHFEAALRLRTDQNLSALDIAESHHNLGRAYWKAARLPEAEQHFSQALALRRRELGAEHALVGETLHNLAGTLRALDRAPEAMRLFAEALDIRERALGPASEEVANTLNSLALLHYTERRYNEAAATARRALGIIREVRGPENWRTARVMHALGVYLTDLGELDEARTLLAESLRVKRLWRADDHPDVRNTQDAIDRLDRLRSARSDETGH